MARRECSNCGQKISTPFCGYCGRRLALTGLEGLLAHIQTRIKMLETGIKNSKQREEYVEKDKETLEKWRSWYKDLYGLMSSCGKKFKLPVRKKEDKAGT